MVKSSVYFFTWIYLFLVAFIFHVSTSFLLSSSGKSRNKMLAVLVGRPGGKRETTAGGTEQETPAEGATWRLSFQWVVLGRVRECTPARIQTEADGLSENGKGEGGTLLHAIMANGRG